jgi:hypothetical protein
VYDEIYITVVGVGLLPPLQSLILFVNVHVMQFYEQGRKSEERIVLLLNGMPLRSVAVSVFEYVFFFFRFNTQML